MEMGGLGIQRASSLALPAFLASAASTLPLKTLILTSINLIPDTHFQDMTSEWCSKSDFNDGDSMPTHKQALSTFIAADIQNTVSRYSRPIRHRASESCLLTARQ